MCSILRQADSLVLRQRQKGAVFLERVVNDGLVLVLFIPAHDSAPWESLVKGHFQRLNCCAVPGDFHRSGTAIPNLMGCKRRDKDEVTRSLFDNVNVEWCFLPRHDLRKVVFDLDIMAKHAEPVFGDSVAVFRFCHEPDARTWSLRLAILRGDSVRGFHHNVVAKACAHLTMGRGISAFMADVTH